MNLLALGCPLLFSRPHACPSSLSVFSISDFLKGQSPVENGNRLNKPFVLRDDNLSFFGREIVN